MVIERLGKKAADIRQFGRAQVPDIPCNPDGADERCQRGRMAVGAATFGQDAFIEGGIVGNQVRCFGDQIADFMPEMAEIGQIP